MMQSGKTAALANKRTIWCNVHSDQSRCTLAKLTANHVHAGAVNMSADASRHPAYPRMPTWRRRLQYAQFCVLRLTSGTEPNVTSTKVICANEMRESPPYHVSGNIWCRVSGSWLWAGSILACWMRVNIAKCLTRSCAFEPVKLRIEGGHRPVGVRALYRSAFRVSTRERQQKGYQCPGAT